MQPTPGTDGHSVTKRPNKDTDAENFIRPSNLLQRDHLATISGDPPANDSRLHFKHTRRPLAGDVL